MAQDQRDPGDERRVLATASAVASPTDRRLRRPNRWEAGALAIGAFMIAMIASGMGGQPQETASAPTTTVTAAPITVTAEPLETTPSTVTVTATVTRTITPAAKTVTRTGPPVARLAPVPGVATPGADTYYANCAAARRAGAAPLHLGEPGYRDGLDRDRDGVACE